MIDLGTFEKIIDAVIQVESAGEFDAVSPAGAKGLMQLMDATAIEILHHHGFEAASYQPFHPKQNRLLGTIYLTQLFKMFGEAKLAFAAYNAGLGRVRALLHQYGNFYAAIELSLPEETQHYVKKIQTLLQKQEIFL